MNRNEEYERDMIIAARLDARREARKNGTYITRDKQILLDRIAKVEQAAQKIVKKQKPPPWTVEMAAFALAAWNGGKTASFIAAEMTPMFQRKITKNAVLGFIHRQTAHKQGAIKRQSPIKKKLIDIDMPEPAKERKIPRDKNLELYCAEPKCNEPIERGSYCFCHANIYYEPRETT